MKIISYLMLFTLLFSNLTYAGFGKKQQGKQAQEDKKNQTVLYYEPTVDGLRKYLETLRYSEPEVYSKLNATVNNYETRDNIGFAVGVTSIVASVALMVGSFTFLAKEDKDFPSGKSPNMGAFFGSMVVWLGGSIASSYIRPDREDFYDFINQHNKLKPNDPLEFSQQQQMLKPENNTDIGHIPQLAEISFGFKF